MNLLLTKYLIQQKGFSDTVLFCGCVLKDLKVASAVITR